VKGWNERKLGDICENLDSHRVPITKKDRVPGEIPYYGASGIVDYVNDFIFDEDLLLVSEDGANLLARVYPIAFSISGKAWVNNHAHVLRFSEIITKKFIEYYLNSIPLNDFVSGMAQPKLNQKFLNSIPVPLPPIPEQKRIVAILDEAFADIEQARTLTEKNLKNARELFESYLQQVFCQRGEGWSEKPLHAVCSFLNGFAFKSKDSVQDSNTQLIRMGNLYKNKLDLKRKPSFYPENFGQEYNRYTLKQGDLIISLTGTVGKEDYGFTVEIPKTEKTLLLNQRIAKIIDVDSLKVDRKFLYRILRSKSFVESLYASAKGTRQANLSTSAMGEILIPLPGLEEQKIFCLNLDVLESQVEELQQKYIKKLVLTDELKKSLLQKAFTGELTAKSAA
jgi:type I restriction enzyme, S subunit